MKIKLDREKLNKTLLDFYTLSHVRPVLFDAEFHRVAAYPEDDCDFCALMRKNPVPDALCREEDARACENCLKNNALYIYQCHAGLIEAVAPVRMNGLTLGYIMFGQVRHAKTDLDEIIRYAERYVADEDWDEMVACAKKIKVRNDRQISAIAGIMEACASYLWIAELIRVDGGALIYRITDYIDNNLTGDLSVDRLCSVFKISRNRLYETARKYYGVSIAKYIRRKRVLVAAEALRVRHCSIGEAARLTGFPDCNYFSKVFKAEMGVTPTEYRASNESNP